MHVLVVISHPDPQSFTHALCAAFCAGLAEGGHTAEIADLHAEGFDPRWSMADVRQFDGAGLPQDVRDEQARIDRADAVCFAFPLYWFAMPAMMKGWIDRVWSYGWAYDQVNEPDQSLQRARIAVMLVPAGGNPEKWRRHGLREAMETLWGTGMLGCFGFVDRRIHILNGAEGSDERRAGLLRQARSIGLTLAP